YPNLMNFSFGPALTAEKSISPDTGRYGDDWASFLLGAIDNNSNARINPFQRFAVKYWAGFIHDDLNLTQRITLNLGLRYQFQTGAENREQHQLTPSLDLTQSIPELKDNPPVLPASVTQYRSAAPIYNGAWLFTDNSNPSAFQTSKHVFLPRVGVAIRINDK